MEFGCCRSGGGESFRPVWPTRDYYLVNPGFDFTTWNSATPGTTHTDSQGIIIRERRGHGGVSAIRDGSGHRQSGPNVGMDQRSLRRHRHNSGGMWDGNGSSSDFQANNWPGNNAFGFVSGSGGSNIRNLISTPIANALQPNTTYTLSLTWYGNPWGNTTVPWSNILVDLTNSAGTALSTLYSASATPVAPTDNGPGLITYTVTTGPGQAVGDLKIYRASKVRTATICLPSTTCSCRVHRRCPNRGAWRCWLASC